MKAGCKIITDGLGFPLEVTVEVGPFEKRGRHRTFVDVDSGLVKIGAPHFIEIQEELDLSDLAEVAAHEAFHLFESIRHLITTDEETRAEIFGQLVQRVFRLGFLGDIEEMPAVLEEDIEALIRRSRASTLQRMVTEESAIKTASTWEL